MADNKTIRRSRRLAAKKVRSRKRQTRLSVLGVTPRGGKAVNLHEAHAIQMGREAATSHDDTRLEGRKGQETTREDETFTWIEPPTQGKANDIG